MNKFPWNCGECPLLQSYDLSVDDLTYVCLWSKAQIDDCDRYKSAQCPLEEHDAKVRVDAIEEFIKAIEKHQQENWIDNLEYGITYSDLEYVAEQLKGEQNE